MAASREDGENGKGKNGGPALSLHPALTPMDRRDDKSVCSLCPLRRQYESGVKKQRGLRWWELSWMEHMPLSLRRRQPASSDQGRDVLLKEQLSMSQSTALCSGLDMIGSRKREKLQTCPPQWHRRVSVSRTSLSSIRSLHPSVRVNSLWDGTRDERRGDGLCLSGSHAHPRSS